MYENILGPALGLAGLESGFERAGTQTVTSTGVSLVRPRDTNDVDIGTSTKRFKTVYYTNLDPVPGGGVGGPFLPLDGSAAMTGDIAMATNDLLNIGSISGATISRTADNIVSNSGASTTGNLPIFSSATGKVVTDSTVPVSSVVIGPANAGSTNIATFNGITGKLLADSSVPVSSVVIGAASVANGNLASYNGTTGKLLADSALAVLNVCHSTAGLVTTNQIPVFDGVTGRALTNSTATIAGGIISCTRVNASTPACGSAGLSTTVSVAFTAGVAQLIDIGTLTEIIDPAGLFTYTAATGKATYTGTPTTTFLCRCLYTLSPPASTGDFFVWLSKNGSTASIPAPRLHGFTVAVLGYTPYETSELISLATGDTVQLIGYDTITRSISFANQQYQFIPVV